MTGFQIMEQECTAEQLAANNDTAEQKCVQLWLNCV